MLKPKTHFEQVSIEIVRKIVQERMLLETKTVELKGSGKHPLKGPAYVRPGLQIPPPERSSLPDEAAVEPVEGPSR